MTASVHVLFGTGRAVAVDLLDRGARVRTINRSSQPVVAGVETIGGAATVPALARAVAAADGTVCFCLNAPNFTDRLAEAPTLKVSS